MNLAALAIEKRAITYFGVALILWITERYNPLNAGLMSLALSLLLFLPHRKLDAPSSHHVSSFS